jgi:hypothetical protein
VSAAFPRPHAMPPSARPPCHTSNLPPSVCRASGRYVTSQLRKTLSQMLHRLCIEVPWLLGYWQVLLVGCAAWSIHDASFPTFLLSVTLTRVECSQALTRTCTMTCWRLPHTSGSRPSNFGNPGSCLCLCASACAWHARVGAQQDSWRLLVWCQ